MAKNYIKPSLEFFDVLSAFPALKEILEKQNFDVSTITEGVTIQNHLENEGMTQKEIEVFMRKLNFELNNFLSEGTDKELQVEDISELVVDDIEKVEEEE